MTPAYDFATDELVILLDKSDDEIEVEELDDELLLGPPKTINTLCLTLCNVQCVPMEHPK